MRDACRHTLGSPSRRKSPPTRLNYQERLAFFLNMYHCIVAHSLLGMSLTRLRAIAHLFSMYRDCCRYGADKS